MARKQRQRLDEALVERGLFESTKQAAGYIMAREVKVNGEIVDQAGRAVQPADTLELINPMPWVSRGGYKLSGVIGSFDINPSGRICADVGVCTGGFTDVLLQAGAKKVYAIDVGYGLIDWKLRQDERVVVMERTNARHVESLDEPVSLVVIDVSFISLKKILNSVKTWLDFNFQPQPEVVALIKPQFEATREQVGQGGIIRDDAVRADIVIDVLQWMGSNGWEIQNLAQSSIRGTEGNIEYLVHLSPSSDHSASRSAEEWFQLTQV